MRGSYGRYIANYISNSLYNRYFTFREGMYDSRYEIVKGYGFSVRRKKLNLLFINCFCDVENRRKVRSDIVDSRNSFKIA